MKKSQSRRKFLRQGAQIGLVTPLVGYNLISCSPKSRSEELESKHLPKSLKILILGGTSFLGPHQVAYALERGHTVTIFTRGKTQPTVYKDLFGQVESLVGDRENNLKALERGQWDLVIDNSGRKVAWTRDSANLLKERVGLYLYTSSTGVYYPYLGSNIHEETPLVLEEPPDITEDQKLEYGYGVMKANSELETIKAFGHQRSLIVRPIYMFGPADRTDRFIYWPVRLSQGGEIMVPGRSNDPVQCIDVRDVAEWMIRLAEDGVTGTFNGVGPKKTHTLPDFVGQVQKAFEKESILIRMDDYDFLKENELYYIVPWIMPEGNNYGSARITNEKAINEGLTFRNLADSMNDTHAWWYSDAVTDERRIKFESGEESILKREKTLIENWKKFQTKKSLS